MVKRLEERTKGLALLGDCCKLPFGYIRDGKLVLVAPHVKPKGHEFELSANDLRSLASVLDWTSGIKPVERW